jgi:FSR family fosmidomycin resistance protein-like MFS transporter
LFPYFFFEIEIMTENTSGASGGFSNRMTLGLACFAHFVNDTYSSFIYPLLPLISLRLDLSPSQAFWLIPVYALFSNLLQPVYGLISDRWLRRGFALSGPLLSAVFLSAMGVSNSFFALAMLLVVGGVGVGIFHPQAAAIAAHASGERRRIGMSMFSAAGTLGTAFGPLIVTRMIEYRGVETTPWLALFGVAAVAFLFWSLPPLEKPSAAQLRANAEAGGLARALQLASGPLLLLYIVTVIRAGTQILVNSYYPFLLKGQGASLGTIGDVLTIFLFAGGIGGLSGGFIAERVGGRAVTIFSGLLSGPFLIAGFLLPGTFGLSMLAIGGCLLGATIPVNVAMAQELVPQRTATISALMMGFAWGVGSLAPRLFEPLTSYIGGYRGVMIIAAVMTIMSAGLAMWLPQDARTKLRNLRTSSEPAMAAGD